jgi:hypothetical protein
MDGSAESLPEKANECCRTANRSREGIKGVHSHVKYSFLFGQVERDEP